MDTVIDMHGIVIKKGAVVVVHQDEGDRIAQVVEPFPGCPTVNQPGWWVDIVDGNGVEGMMSYILEVEGGAPCNPSQ
ncbi:hypothetical protein LCGC14_1545000 [marine sediment metagenome]|uniref:Uncharacterized protein n=1 Tax=marine sediment metagenome TaxID=412755 RepID=A0A0F9IRT9_9ZZZZ